MTLGKAPLDDADTEKPGEVQSRPGQRKGLEMSVATRESIVPQPRPIRAYDRRTGAALMLVPSASRPNVYHRVSSTQCDCPGFGFRGSCSHLEVARRELAAPVIDDCGICDVPHPCHCPRMRSGCDRCIPQSTYSQRLGEPVQMRSRIPLVGRVQA